MEILKNDKVRLRAVEPHDTDIIFDVEISDLGCPDSCWFAPLSKESVMNYAISYSADPFRDNGIRLIIERNSDKAIIGLIDLYDIDKFHSRAFVSIYILEEYRNKNYASNAVALISKYADSVLGLHQIAAKIMASNVISQKLFSNCGFKKQAIIFDWLYDAKNRCYKDMIIYQKIF